MVEASIEFMAKEEWKMRFPQYHDGDPVLDVLKAIDESGGGGKGL